MAKSSKPKFTALFSDKTSGSSDILIELHTHLKREQKMLEVFPDLINVIKHQFESFQSVQSYLKELSKSLYDGNKLDDFFKKYDYLLENIYSRIYNKNKNILKKFNTIITISNSKTVFEILKLLKQDNPKIKVLVCESRPKLEGRLVAKKLFKLKIRTELILEASIAAKLKKTDAALIGADMILKNGNVINKIGSLTLATLCKYYSIPLYVIADASKFSLNNNFKQKEMPPQEIWRQSNSKIIINNFYFEEVENKFISKIFTS